MTQLVVAYANEWTKMEWQMIATFDEPYALDHAKKHIAAILPNMQNSALAIFSRDNGPTYWADRRPRYIYNRHILYRDAPISAAVGGIINHLESDWF